MSIMMGQTPPKRPSVKKTASTPSPIEGAVQMLRDLFPGFHIHMELYPAGGSIELEGCEECGTEGRLHQANWQPGRKRLSTASEAIAQLKKEI